MKIFAKRTKKKADPSAAAAPRTVNKSDPVVEELLEKDPSEWNAKERRMVKRYRDRKAAEASAAEATPDETRTEPETAAAGDDDSGEAQDASESKGKPTEKSGESDSDGDSSDSSSSSDDDSDNEAEANDDSDSGSDSSSKASPEKKKGAEISKPVPVRPREPETPVSPAAEHTEDGKDDDDDDDNGKVPEDHEIWSVLDKLNSKQKRTLTRKLDRLGKRALDEVEQEANKILDEVSPLPVEPTNAAKRANAGASAEASSPPTKKRKKGKTASDWSHLPAEERLRREEQRRKQKEAAERRARGEDIAPGHKRPLNSARRRANRRKPKWAAAAANKPTGAPDISDYKREHHSSGFLHRKNRGGARNE